MATDSEETLQQLNRLVQAKTGDQAARAHSLETLPGHAGFSYSFVLERSSPLAPSGKLVLRLAPPNVKIAGPADIVRQAKIMASFAGTVVPVPPIYWYGDEPQFFARPYFVVGFLEGVKLADAPFPADHMGRLARKGVETLAALHALPWQPRRDAFGDPFPLAEEMKRLDYLLDRPTLDPAVVARAPELRERLRATLPTDARLGCVHGDFQWSNVLFDSERPIALIDWEIASIGPTLIDLGWLSFFADADSWVETAETRVRPLSPEEIFETYARAAAFPVSAGEVRWFRAFAGYRFGVITCFNLMLHRRGKRDDPHWEDIALSAPRMFERGLELIG
ncbi:MAG TPA: phosphotransferase family protein [Candidatus Binataceae bacterium]|nr:phosphotransferase family protein [Candidatus Binataceae bacterium]